MSVRSQRGSNLVEMAIVLPLLLLLLAGVVDIGRMFNNYIIVANAAREGARLAARLPCYVENATQRALLRSAIVDAVIQEAADSGISLESGNVSINPDPAGGCADAGYPIRVTVVYQYDTLLGSIIGIDSLTLPSSTAMVCYGNDQE